MAWRTVTEQDLLQKFSSDELEALRSAGLASGQADPIAGHIEQLVNFVQGFIAANPANTVGEAGTLPERLILPAIDYLVVEVSSRVAGLLIDLNNTRVQARKDALALFDRVANNRYAVEQPATAGVENDAGVAVEQANSTTNHASRDSLAGL